MKVFTTREKAEADGFRGVGYRQSLGPYYATNSKGEEAVIRTPLEAQQHDALLSVQRLAGHCPCCGEMRGRDHTPRCTLSLALKAFRGEP